MGQESYVNQVKFKNFLGLNTKMAPTDIDYRECTGVQNVVSVQGGLIQRLGSTFESANTFKDKTDTTAKPITGLFTGFLSGTQEYVGTGGDAFKEFTGGSWVDRTGAVTITDSPNNLTKSVVFFDGSANDIIITAFESGDAPIKWTGSGNAAALASPPGNFKYPVVHKNKLWVVIDDIVYFSALLNGESWDTTNDIARFQGNGENITGIASYRDYLVVFKPTGVFLISGSSTRDLSITQVISGEGCSAPYSIREVDSKRYGRILIFVNNDGLIKGFNGTPNLLPLGDYAESLFKSMNLARLKYVSSMVMESYNQYWASYSFGSGSENSQVVCYDYFNDYFTGEDGRPLSAIFYHVGINANAMATWETSGTKQFFCGNYDGQLLLMDDGFSDEESGGSIPATWITGRIDFGDASVHKMLNDLNTVTTQSTSTTLALTVTTDLASGIGTEQIAAVGGLWGSMLWGTGLWSSESTAYTRFELTPQPSTSEEAVTGRYFTFQLSHNTSGEAMQVEEFLAGITSLGQEAQYREP